MEQSSAPRLPRHQVPRRHDWMDARTTRRFADVERLGNAILQAKPNDEFVQRSLARLMTELDRAGDAKIYWKQLRDQNASDFEASFHVAKALVDEGKSAESAAHEAAPGGTQALRLNLCGVLEQRHGQPSDCNVRHISICGVSYCGSTLMDRVLAGLPGVRSIGESHWLIKARYGDRYDLADFASDIAPKFVPCSVCGPGCAVLTPLFRRELAADPTNWYFKIARRLDTKILVSADKNPPKLVDNDPLLRFDSIVLFKSPMQAWFSQLSKLPTGRDADYYASECERYLIVWSRSYQTFIERFNPQGKVAFVNFDTFARRPREILSALCRALSLPFDESVLRVTKPGHAIGGNMGSVKKLREKDYGVDIQPLPEPKVPSAHLDLIERHAEAQQIFAWMMAACEPVRSV